MSGNIGILELAQTTGREIPTIAASWAARQGQIAVLDWMNERDLIVNCENLWSEPFDEGCIGVLDWLYANDCAVYRSSVWEGAATGDHFEEVLTWARDHGITWDEGTCIAAAFEGNLPMLQWLRANGCPWDSRVILAAQLFEYNHVVEWAIANGCPVE